MKSNGRETPYDELVDELRKKSVSELLKEQEVIWNSEEVDPNLLLAYDKVLVEKGHGAEDVDVDESLSTFKANHPEFFPAPPVEANESTVVVVAFLPRMKKAILRRANMLPTALCIVVLFLFFAQAGYLTQWITEVKDGTYSVLRASGSVELPAGEDVDFHSLQEALDNYGIADKIEPTWIPERFQFKSVKVMESENGIMIIAQYVADMGDDMSLFVSTDLSSVPKNEMDESLGDPENYPCNGVTFKISPNIDQYSAYWVTEHCVCQINGGLAEQELKAVINSIYKE